MKIFVFGAGFLGTRIAHTVPGATLIHADIADRAAVIAMLRSTRPDVVVNAAGKTGRPNVDWCETNQEETYRSNVLGALALAEACAAIGAYFVHLASGCIFYGRSPHPDGAWRESDHANPESFYSRSKYAADLILSRLADVAVVRLRMPIDGEPSDRNLITKLARYRQVIDVENSVTIVDDLVTAVHGITLARATGVFHAVNQGTVRHSEILDMYCKFVDPAHTYELIRPGELVSRGLAVAPRSNCVLADTKNLRMPHISESLEKVMQRYATSRR